MTTPTAAEREAAAKADKAEADARKAELELADMQSLDGVLARAAKNRQSAAEADKAAMSAKQAEISSLIPDLSKVKDSTITATSGAAIGGSALTFGGLAHAADEIAKKVAPEKAQRRFLVTSDSGLASDDTVYLEVTGGLGKLQAAATRLLAETAAPKDERRSQAGRGPGIVAESVAAGAAAGMAAGPLVGAVAAAIPQVLSVLSAERSLATQAITVSDLAAAAAVAGALIALPDGRARVMHDEFRLVSRDPVQKSVDDLSDARMRLAARKLELAVRKSTLEAEMKDGGTAQQKATIATIVASASLVDSLLASIDAFITGIRAVPEGGMRTPLGTASLYHAIHDTSRDGITHVLLVKAQAAQSAMLTDDRPLWFADKFSSLVEVNVTFMLLEAPGAWLIQSGTATAMTMAHGRLGEGIWFEERTAVISGNGPSGNGSPSKTWQSSYMRGDRTTGDDHPGAPGRSVSGSRPETARAARERRS
jgi:hypothetical protein